MSDFTHSAYPNASNSNGLVTQVSQVPPIDIYGSTLGLGGQERAFPRIPNVAYMARGRGLFDLREPKIPPSDARFVRGPRLNGYAGTLDVWFTAPAAGTARTLCYLTDDPTGLGNIMVMRFDDQNRPLVTLTAAGGATPATGTLTATSNFSDTETVVIDGKTYTFQASLTEVDGNVFIGASLAISLANLKAAINLEAGGGSLYANATTLHPTVTATASDATTLTVQAKAAGPGGNSITTTETAANASWGGATLSGGSVGGTIVGEVTPSGSAIPEARTVHVRLAWDSANPVNGLRYANVVINDEVVDGDWSTDPTSSWAAFRPTHLVLGQGYDTDSDIADATTVLLVQGSNTVTL